MKGLLNIRKEYSALVTDVRGMGLLVGMEMTRECGDIVKSCMERGLLINHTAGNVLRFMPPLIVQEKDIDHLLDMLDDVLGRLS